MFFFLSPCYCLPLIKRYLTASEKIDLKKAMNRAEAVTGEEEVTKYI